MSFNLHPSLPRFPTWITRLLHWLTGISIRYKLMGMVLAVILFLGAVVTVQVQAQLAENLNQSLEERGIALGLDLAEDSTDLLLTQNIFALHQNIRSALETNPDVRYVFILDQRGQVVAHSFPNRVPPDLLGANIPDEGVPWRTEILKSEEGLLTDIGVPIFKGQLGTVHLGLSHQRLEQAVDQAALRVIYTTLVALLIGGLAVLLLTRILTRPIFELVEAARAVSRGNLEVRPAVRMADEIGELTVAFNSMTEDLAHFRDELLRQNQDLATLNTLARDISGTRTLREVLNTTLKVALSALDSPAGWVVLSREEASALDMAAYQGLSGDFRSHEWGRDSLETATCLCAQIMDGSSSWQQPILRDDCPRLLRAQRESLPEACFDRHLSVPLIAHDQPVGVLNLAFGSSYDLKPEQIKLAGAIGHQVGVAIDAEIHRQRLVTELKQREQLRGQLLKRVLAVQEEERRRIARELHDEAGQSLTLLIVGLRLLESEVDDPPALLTRIKDLKQTTDNVLENLHRLAMDLRPVSLDHLGLVAALQQYADLCAQRYRLRVQFEPVGLSGLQLPHEVENHLYRIIQEALANVARHARATRADVLLEKRGSCLVAIVEDDGIGFSPPEDSTSGRLGLFGMRERVEMLGGKLTIESSPNKGAAIYLEIPL